MRILIVDDHAMVREGLKRILLDEFKDASFGEAGNATEALEQIWKRGWELVLLDVSMHGRSGLDVLKEIRASSACAGLERAPGRTICSPRAQSRCCGLSR